MMDHTVPTPAASPSQLSQMESLPKASSPVAIGLPPNFLEPTRRFPFHRPYSNWTMTPSFHPRLPLLFLPLRDLSKRRRTGNPFSLVKSNKQLPLKMLQHQPPRRSANARSVPRWFRSTRPTSKVPTMTSCWAEVESPTTTLATSVTVRKLKTFVHSVPP